MEAFYETGGVITASEGSERAEDAAGMKREPQGCANDRGTEALELGAGNRGRKAKGDETEGVKG